MNKFSKVICIVVTLVLVSVLITPSYHDVDASLTQKNEGTSNFPDLHLLLLPNAYGAISDGTVKSTVEINNSTTNGPYLE